MSLVSILMPVKNEEQYLEACLASIEVPSGLTLEVILVDDHSTDATLSMAQRVAESRNDLSLVVLENVAHGKAAALNLAYRHASGTRFVLLAGDDLLVSDMLSDRIAAVDEPTPAVAQCRYVSFSDDPRYDGIVFPRRAREEHLAGGATSFNRAFAELYFPIPEALPNEDTWLRAIFLLFGVRFRFLDGIGLRYRVHRGNSMGPMREFAQTSLGLSERHLAFELALQQFPDPALKGRARLQSLVTAERYRTCGRWWRLLQMPGLSLADRVVFLINATPWLYALKHKGLPLLKG